MGDRKPGRSMLRETIGLLQSNGVVVLPKEWDAEFVTTEVNVWLRTNFKKGKLVEQASLGAEGIVGAKVHAILLRPLDDNELPRNPNSAGGRGRSRKA